MQRNLSETKKKKNLNENEKVPCAIAKGTCCPLSIPVLTSPAAWVEFYFFERQIQGLPPSPMRRECGSNRRSLR